MFDVFELQKQLFDAAIGDLSAKVAELARPFADKVEIDRRGNVICSKQGKGRILRLAAPMEGAGFWVTGADERGYLRLEASGSIPAAILPSAPLRFSDGLRGSVRFLNMSDILDKKWADIRMTDLFADIGAKKREEAEKLAPIGTRVLLDGMVGRTGNAVFVPCGAPDGACVALLLMLEQLAGEQENQLEIVFFSGKGGEPELSHKSDWTVTVTACPAGDTPEKKEGYSPLELGKGPALLLGEGPGGGRNSERIAQAAESAHAALQRAVSTRAWVDAGELTVKDRGRGGIGVPMRNLHTQGVTYREEDVRETARLLCALAAIPLEQEGD